MNKVWVLTDGWEERQKHGAEHIQTVVDGLLETKTL